MTPYYDADGITIYHGEALDVLRHLPAGSCDVLLTDPPYSSGGMFRSDRQIDPADKYRGWSHSEGGTRPPAAEYGTFAGDSRDQRAWTGWVTAWSFAALRTCCDDASAFIFSDWRQLPAATDAVQYGGWVWRGIVVWDKGVGRPMKGRFRNHLEYIVWATNGAHVGSDSYPSSLIAVPTVRHKEREHVTQKPVDLIHSLFSVVPKSAPLLVLDPFMGSGTTLRAAADAGHRAIGIELDERHCETAAKRLAQGSLFGPGAA